MIQIRKAFHKYSIFISLCNTWFLFLLYTLYAVHGRLISAWFLHWLLIPFALYSYSVTTSVHFFSILSFYCVCIKLLVYHLTPFYSIYPVTRSFLEIYHIWFSVLLSCPISCDPFHNSLSTKSLSIPSIDIFSLAFHPCIFSIKPSKPYGRHQKDRQTHNKKCHIHT